MGLFCPLVVIERLHRTQQRVGIVDHRKRQGGITAHRGGIIPAVGGGVGIAHLHKTVAQPLRQQVGHIVLVRNTFRGRLNHQPYGPQQRAVVVGIIGFGVVGAVTRK